jgi:hypothetical protein
MIFANTLLIGIAMLLSLLGFSSLQNVPSGKFGEISSEQKG